MGDISLWVRNPSYTGREDRFLYLLCPAEEAGRKDVGETLRLLYRGIFGGWLRRAPHQMDRERLPFFRWMGEKLTFFLPVSK